MNHENEKIMKQGGARLEIPRTEKFNVGLMKKLIAY